LDDVTTPEPEVHHIYHLHRDQLLLLYHQRLGHMHYLRLSQTQKKTTGMPKLRTATVFDNCPVCQQAKARKANKGSEPSSRAGQCGQGISIDFGFIVQSSKDSKRMERLCGMQGQTCYCLITDHHTGMLWGDTFNSKAPPIDFLNRWLLRFGLPVASRGTNGEGKYVRFDKGGELGNNQAIVNLFQHAGYAIEPTAPDNSSSNGLGERPHRTIKEALRAMLSGAGLDPKFWPFAFRHFLYLYNLTPHGTRPQSPYSMRTGKIADISHLRVFGCRVFCTENATVTPHQLALKGRPGIFLGFCGTTRNIIWWDTQTKKLKTSRHSTFDESENGSTTKTPNAELLFRLRSGQDPDTVFTAPVSVPDLDVSLSPFPVTNHFDIPLDVDAASPIGITATDCSILERAFVSAMTCKPKGTSIKTFRKKFKGSYIVSLNKVPISDASSFTSTLAKIMSSPEPPAYVQLELAPTAREDILAPAASSLILRPHDLHRISALNTVDGEGMSTYDYAAAIDSAANCSLDSSTDYCLDVNALDKSNETMVLINRLQTEGMTDEERGLTKFTRTRLKRLANWPQWDAAFKKQLNQHYEAGTLGKPVLKSLVLHTAPDGVRPTVLRFVWNNLVKADGTRKTRACCDGSARAAPWLRQFAQTYSSCIETPCMRMFFALSAAQNYVVTIADVQNAYQQSPGPKVPSFLHIDDAYSDWHSDRFGASVDPRRYVIPVKKALQGHPEAGALFETFINKILIDEFGLKNTTHETNLYRGQYLGQDVMICRMVDDLAIATASAKTAEALIAKINSKLTIVSEGIGVLVERKGYHARYNGLDVYQTRDYVKLGCDTYISRLLQTHGWEAPVASAPDKDGPPITDAIVKSLSLLDAPAEGTSGHKTIEESAGFSYRQLLGALMYAYVVARPDIGYAICFLARFAGAPNLKHYVALKNVAKYLRHTKDWGIVYWRSKPVSSLPAVMLTSPPVDTDMPTFPEHAPTELVAFVDAAHGTDLLKRKSVTGMVFCLAGGAIAYRSKLQATIATSSTEAELYAAVSAAKVAKYLRTVLFELGFPPSGPTILHEDNQAVINIVNNSKPTSRARHVEIQFFAIQEWRRRKQVELKYIDTRINTADAETKALGWTLHSRHSRRMLGHVRPAYAMLSN